jgi:hypothetical protein
MADFRHYILTRFNAGLYNRAAQRELAPDEWMEHRFALFTCITLPSIAGQSCRNFTWLVLVDERTPERYLRRFEAMDCSMLRLVYTGRGRGSWFQGIEPGAHDLITTRIDNDDAFHVDTVQAIQDAWRAEARQRSKPWAIVLPFGLIYDLSDRKGWIMEYWFNNCPTLVEDAQGAATIWQWQHDCIPARVGKCHITDKPYWLQTVHGHNLRNVVDSTNPLRIVHKELPSRPEHLRYFNIDPNALPAQ